MAHFQEESSSTETIQDANILDLLDKYFTLTIINMFKELKEVMGKELKSTRRKCIRSRGYQIKTVEIVK